MTPAPKRARNPKTGETVVLVGGQWVPEPKAETQAPANAPAPAPAAPSQRRYDMQPTTPLEGLKRDVGRGLAEAGQGVLSAVTFGGDDEIAGGINAAMGGDYEAGRAKAEARKTALQARSKARAEEYGVPISSYGAGEFAGTVAQTAATGGLSQGGSLAARGARVLGSAAGGGAAEGALNAQPGDRLAGAARGAATGAALAGAMKAPAKLVSSVAKHAPGLSRRADLARLRSVGINPAHADELPGGIEGTTETLRKHGVGKGILTGSGGMERQASAAVDQIEARRGALAANAANAVAPGANVAGPIRAAAPRIDDDAAKYYNRKADEFAFRTVEKQVPAPRPAAPAPNELRVLREAIEARKAAPDRISGLEPTQVASRPIDPNATMPGGRRPRPAAPPPAPPPAPEPEMMTVRERVPRELSFAELQQGRRHYSPDNWAAGSQEAQAGKDISQAFSAAEADAVSRANAPSAGAEYRQLGREEAHLLRARKGLLGGADQAAGARAVPLNAHDAARLLTPAGVLGNNKTKLLEAGAGVAKRAGRAAPGMAERAAARAPVGSILTREAVRNIENSEYPEDEYFRQYMSNPDFRFSR
jgi:hypothetical protein